MGMDFAVDMAESSHLNYSGNYKFTDYLGKVISEGYDIPDRRGDSRYVSWERDAAFQRNERCDNTILNSDDFYEVMSLTEYGYIVFAVNEGVATVFENNEAVSTTEGPFRLTYSSGNDSFLFLDEEEGNIHTCSLFVNDTQYTEDYGNLIFIYDTVTDRYIRSMRF